MLLLRTLLSRPLGYLLLFALILSTPGLLTPLPVHAATITWDGGGATNDWSDCDNWSTNICPGSSDVATFNSTSTKDATIDAAFAGSLSGISITTGYTGIITAARDLTVGTGNWSQTTGTFNAASYTFSVAGTFTQTGGTFNADTSSFVFASSGSRTVNVNTTATFYNLEISATSNTNGISISSGDTLIVSNTLTLTNGVANGNGGMRADGSVSLNTGFDGGVAVISLNADIDLAPSTGQVLPGLTLTDASSSYTGPAGGTVTFGGAVNLGSGTFNAGNGTTNFQGNFTIGASSTFNNDSGTIAFTGGSTDSTVDVQTSASFYNLEINSSSATGGVTISTGDTLIVTNTTTLTNGELTGPGTLRVDGTLSAPSTFDGGTGVLDINVAIAITPDSGTVLPGMTLTNAGSSFTNAGTVTFEGAVNVSSGTFNAGAGTTNFSGNLTIGASSTFNHNSGTVAFTGGSTDSTVDVNSTFTFNNLTVNATSASGGLLIASGDTLVVSGVTTLSNGEFTGPGGLQVDGTIAVDAGFDGGTGVLTINAATSVAPALGAVMPGLTLSNAGSSYTGPGNISFEGSVDVGTATFNAGSGTTTLSTGSLTVGTGGTFNHDSGTLSFTGNAAQTIDVDSTITLGGLAINKSSTTISLHTVSIGVGDTLLVTGNLTLTNGQFSELSSGDGKIQVSGTTISDSSSYDGGDATIEMIGATTYTTSSTRLNPLTLNHASAVFNGPTAGNTSAFEGDITITNGTFNAGAGTIELLFDWTLNGGTFNHDSGTILLSDADHTFTGSTTFYNLSTEGNTGNAVRTFTFEAGSTTTIANQAILGTELAPYPTGYSLLLRSSSAGSQADFDVQSSHPNVSFHDIDVKDINNTGTTVECRVRCVDSGNNAGFIFGDDNIIVSDISGDATEAGGTATFTAVLNSKPSADVTIGVSSTDTSEGTVSPASLTFTSVNWNTPQTVTVTGVSDSDDDGRVTYTITLAAATSADAGYNGLNPVDVTAATTDDDSATDSFDFDVLSGYVVEDVKDTGDAPIAWYTGSTQGSLMTASDGVEVNLDGSDIAPGCKITVGGSEYTIVYVYPNAYWPGYISITPEPGVYQYDGSIPSGVVSSITCARPNGSGITHTTDDYIADRRFEISGRADYVARYDSANDAVWFDSPSFLTKIDDDSGTTTSVAAAVTRGCCAAGIALDTSRNRIWMTNHSSDSITAVNTTDGTYAFGTGVASTFAVSDGPLRITYDATNDALWVLSAGASDVLSKVNPADGSVITTLTLDTTSNGNFSTRGITYDATNDAVWAVYEAGRKLVKVDGSAGTFYNGTLANSSYFLQFTDNDFASSADALYDVALDVVWVLNGQCDSVYEDYVAKVRASDGVVIDQYPVSACPVSLQLSGSSLFVTSDAGNITQIRTTDGQTIEPHMSEGSGYALAIDGEDDLWYAAYNDEIFEYVPNGVADDFYYTVTSSDATQLDVSSATAINSGTVTETLDSANVYYSFSFDDRVSFKVFTGGAWRVIASSLNVDHGGVEGTWYYRDNADTWTAASVNNANRALSQAVAAGANNQMSGATTSALTGGNWEAAGGFTTSVNTLDVATTLYTTDAHNSPSADNLTFSFSSVATPGITVTESSGSTNVTEAGSTDSYTVVLDTLPADSVTVTISPNSQITTDLPTLTFTTANWDTPQTVTVTAVDDDLAEGAHTGSITHSATSADSNYNAIAINSVTPNVTDNDTAGFDVSEISGNTTEAGGTATFTVALTSEPANDVTVGVSSNDTTEGTVAISELVFTSANWSAPQTVTVTGADDDVDDGDIAYAVVLAAATSADGDYNAVNPNDVSVSNTDNDTAGITVGSISGNTTEDGGTATFTVVLTSEPANDVTIDVSSNNTDEGTVSAASLTFTSVNWDTPQTVTVTGVDDALTDGDIDYTVILAAAVSADVQYNGMNPTDVDVTNVDNDAASGGGGGGGVTPTLTPTNTSVAVLGIDTCSPSTAVTLQLTASNASSVLISNDASFATGSWETFIADNTVTPERGEDGYLTYTMTKPWTLASSTSTQIVYVRFKSVNGGTSSVESEPIDFTDITDCSPDSEEPTIPEPEEPAESPETPPVEDDSAEEPEIPTVPESPATDSGDGSGTDIGGPELEGFVRTPDSNTVYAVAPDGSLRPFTDLQTYLTYADSCGEVTYVEHADLDISDLGSPMIPKPGSVLVQLPDDARVYALETHPDDTNKTLFRWIQDENVAEANFGTFWRDYVISIPAPDPSVYEFGTPIVADENLGESYQLRSRAALNNAVTYDLYIVNPDGSRRYTLSNYARVEYPGDGTLLYGFEDKGVDFDYNDVYIRADGRDCLTLNISTYPLEAAWRHQIGVEIYYEGIRRDDFILWEDSHAAVDQAKIIDLSNLENIRNVTTTTRSAVEEKQFYIGDLFAQVVEAVKTFIR